MANDDSQKQKKGSCLKSAFSVLGSGIFVLLMLVIGAYGVFSNIGYATEANEWLAKAVRVPAVITKVEPNESKSEKGSWFNPWVYYKLSYNGKEYSPEVWQLYHKWSPKYTKEEVDALLRPYEVGHTVSAYVYPDDPSKSFLDPSNPNVFSGFYVTEIYFAAFLAFGLFCVTCLIGRAVQFVKPDLSISERTLVLPSLLSWVIFCDAMMVWYWTHSAPPHSWSSYALFGFALGWGLLSVFNWKALRTVYGACSYVLWFIFSPQIIRRKK